MATVTDADLMTDPFPQLGGREILTNIAPDTVLVGVGSFDEACTLFVGCQTSGATLASNTVWIKDLGICSALAIARISMEYHQDCWEFDHGKY